jgi:hypothetical protein
MKKILTSGLIVGVILFILGYGGLYIAINAFPEAFVEYNSPLFNSDPGKDILFYSHAFIVALALSALWERFKELFKGHHFVVRGIEFGFIYALVALLPVLWITYSALDVSITTVGTWFIYGLVQALIGGVLFAKLNP